MGTLFLFYTLSEQQKKFFLFTCANFKHLGQPEGLTALLLAE